MTVHFAPVDEDTADLLSLVADENHYSTEYEWRIFVEALETVAAITGGAIRPNLMRPRITGLIAPRRVGAFYSRASREGLIHATGDYEISDDTAGRNSGKPCRLYRAAAGAPASLQPAADRPGSGAPPAPGARGGHLP